MADLEMARRWRLILGRYADRSLAEGCSAPGDLELDQLLGYLYDREYTSRGLTVENRTGGRESSVLRAVTWLERSRELFTRDTFERLQTQ
ncbi:MAG: hypothetical protein LBU05_01625, partial [Bifidobacteriaceae bacterium]|nr:hypothetical protein [Bifidobacteriaceae bacterium]